MNTAPNRAKTSTLTYAIAACVVGTFFSSGAVSKDATGGEPATNWEIPSAPDVNILETRFPSCNLDSLDATRKCLRDLEFYRSQVLEATFHKGSLREYIRALTRMSQRLELARANGQINTSDYDGLHEKLADKLDEATSSDGLYAMTYQNYFAKYKGQARDAEHKLDVYSHVI